MGERPYQGDDLIGVCAALAAVQILIVAARFYTRYMQQMRCGLDDYLILVALVSAANIAKTVIFIVCMHSFFFNGEHHANLSCEVVKIAGLGYHVDYIISTAPQDLLLLRKVRTTLRRQVLWALITNPLQKGYFAIEILDFPFAVTSAKVSLLLFYVRIFSVRRFQIFAYVVGTLVLVHGIVVLFTIIFQCKPVPYVWDKTIRNGTCFVQQVLYRFVSPPNVLTGILILIMPIPFVWKLHAPRAQKMALTAVFLLGGLGTVASILRMVNYYMCTVLAEGDLTWYSVELGILSQVESGVLVIAACLITIWPLITRLLPRNLLKLFFFGTDRERECQRWYMHSTQTRRPHDNTTSTTTTTSSSSSSSESRDELARYSQDMGQWPLSSRSVPASLADLEDQRWSIFADEMKDAEKWISVSKEYT
ncbi:hypothetical protein N7474_002920 [Penicillium riverlandense]|uniref:uncharacterized protein n=1 Tax=Penicillium riverlandense TaxID=1903569 RepID=UPI002548CA16|nr:uncharacterized protein N7474_002920 [Penicillium riverlandense]KAJ5825782.1 hypothetical protein N7474_002920 [Penicillium riverlandense]